MSDFDPEKLDEDLFDSLRPIAPVTHRFAGSNANALMAVVLGAIGVLITPVGPILFIMFLVREERVELTALTTVLLGVGGYFFCRFGLRNLNMCVYVGERGFAVIRRKTVMLFPFSELKQVKYTKLNDTYDHEGRPAMNRETFVDFVRKDGAVFGVNRANLKKFLTFSRLIYDKTRPYDVPWVLFTTGAPQ